MTTPEELRRRFQKPQSNRHLKDRKPTKRENLQAYKDVMRLKTRMHRAGCVNPDKIVVDNPTPSRVRMYEEKIRQHGFTVTRMERQGDFLFLTCEYAVQGTRTGFAFIDDKVEDSKPGEARWMATQLAKPRVSGRGALISEFNKLNFKFNEAAIIGADVAVNQHAKVILLKRTGEAVQVVDEVVTDNPREPTTKEDLDRVRAWFESMGPKK